jgi:hypothetical protein
MKLRKLKISAILLTAALAGILFAYTAHAAYSIPDSLRPDNMPLDIKLNYEGNGTEYLITILQIIAGSLLYLAAPVAVIMIAMSGFNMVAYSGSEEKAAEAKKFLTWAVMGLVLIIFSYSLIKIIITFVPGVFDEIELTPTTTVSEAQPANP